MNDIKSKKVSPLHHRSCYILAEVHHPPPARGTRVREERDGDGTVGSGRGGTAILAATTLSNGAGEVLAGYDAVRAGCIAVGVTVGVTMRTIVRTDVRTVTVIVTHVMFLTPTCAITPTTHTTTFVTPSFSTSPTAHLRPTQ